jgi:tartrate dehydrogenase/decarboxylase/D-malate dehydrogenase
VGQAEAGRRVQQAVERVILRGDVRTPDLGGKATTAEFTDAVVREIS